MTKLQRMLTGAAAAVVLVANPGAGAQAQTLMEEWASAKLPSPPALKPATIVPNETALLVMDFTNQTCTKERRQRCADSVAKVRDLVTQARAKGALIVYSVAVPNSVPADILKELTPAAGELVLPPLGPDKFIGRTSRRRSRTRASRPWSPWARRPRPRCCTRPAPPRCAASR